MATVAGAPTPVPLGLVRIGEHIIYRNVDLAKGPTLIAIGSIHGNEAAGVRALQRVAAQLTTSNPQLHGRVVFLAGNTRALSKGVRYIDADLNRHWTPHNIQTNRTHTNSEKSSEDLEQAELLTTFDQLINTATGEVYAVDLHSTSAGGVPFATVGDTMRNRRFALKLPVTILLGIEEQLDGTLLEYLNNLGVVTLGFEGGQHYAEITVDNHAALIWLGLVNSGIIDENAFGELSFQKRTLADATGHSRIVEVRYRHAITADQNFQMKPGFLNFEPIRKGEILANDNSGPIHASESGMILMPLYQKLGEDGFFIGHKVARFWLWLSGVVRRLKLAKLMPLLPGVKRRDDPETLEVDTRIARFFPLQIFHLLGFRKRRWENNKLVVSRRKFDIASPFTPDI